MNLENSRKTALYKSTSMLTLFSYFIALSIIPSALHYDANEVFVTLLKFAFFVNACILLYFPLPQFSMNNDTPISPELKKLSRSFNRPLTICEENLPLVAVNILAFCFSLYSANESTINAIIVQAIILLLAALYIGVIPLWMRHNFSSVPRSAEEIIYIVLHVITLAMIDISLYMQVFDVTSVFSLLIYILLYISLPITAYMLTQYTALKHAGTLHQAGISPKKPSVLWPLMIFITIGLSGIVAFAGSGYYSKVKEYAAIIIIYSLLTSLATVWCSHFVSKSKQAQ